MSTPPMKTLRFVAKHLFGSIPFYGFGLSLVYSSLDLGTTLYFLLIKNEKKALYPKVSSKVRLSVKVTIGDGDRTLAILLRNLAKEAIPKMEKKNDITFLGKD